ncbi:MAG: DUF58 domain-containing protein [Planctomycetes bacterium]|nr:DUF58 domain-containing protein [Planctomycetota bacterium]
MIPPELLKKVRRIEIRTGRLVDSLLGGAYHSAFKGRGMEFEDVREYVPGDEIRAIDWNVTARAGTPHVKNFREERELTVLLLVDVSRSEFFGSGEQRKSDLVAEFASLLALAALRNGDKVGLALFSDRVERYIPPKKGRRHALRLIRDLLAFRPASRGTSVGEALSFIGKVLKRRAVVFLVSDLLDEGFERDLAAARSRHDVVAVRVADPREAALPDVGLVTLEDAETGETVLVDTGSTRFREAFASGGEGARKRQTDLLRSLRVDELSITTGKDYVPELTRFFRMREKRAVR